MYCRIDLEKCLFVWGILIVVSLWESGLFFAEAQVDDAYFVVVCDDGRQIVGHRVVLDALAPQSFLRVTMVGVKDFDPAFAIVDREGDVECSNNEERAGKSIVAIPSLGRVEANDFAAQRNVNVGGDGRLELIVGGFPGQSGQYALVIENVAIEPIGEADRLLIQVPPAAMSEWLNVFMVGKAVRLDPYMALFFEEGSTQPEFECDNAGTTTCKGTPNLVDRGAVISGEEAYPGDAFDAGIMGAFQQEQLYYEFRDVTNANTGEYVIVIVGMAPGAVIDTSLICDNVVVDVRGSSPSYNPSYEVENILDGDPTTFWVTGAPPMDPLTGTRSQNAFIVVGVEGEQPISKIRVNGYVQSPQETIEQNSLRLFAVRFPNVEGEVVSAIEAELLLQPGYQTYAFLPATIEEIGMILLDNYGGTLFTVVDVQVCAAP